MFGRGLSFAAILVLGLTGLAHAQDVLSTQKGVALGGTDQRGLPNVGTLPPPFGSTLFTAAKPAPGTAAPSLTAPASQPMPSSQPRSNYDPSYIVQPGDAVDIQLYGATSISAPSTVNAGGDIFIPTVGPVHVAGQPASQLQSSIDTAVQQVYVRDVKVYSALLSAIPVNVFVTGPVARPGQYPASSTDSVIAILQYAGGIDPVAGSYRDIRIVRHGRVIQHIDLYEFLIEGHLPPFALHNGDTIVVGKQGLSVAVMGSVRGAYRYELTPPYTGDQVIALARPLPDATHVALIGVRGGRPGSAYMTLEQFAHHGLEDGDIVRMVADIAANTITVTIDGRVEGQTTLVLRRDATLLEVLSYIPVSNYFADTESIYLRRASVAAAQKKSIQESVLRLEQAVTSTPVVSDSDATIRVQEEQLVEKFAQEALAVQPEGRVIISRGGKVGDVRLEDGDVIVVPARTDLVTITGEVSIPQAVRWSAELSVNDYLTLAGGVTERGDTSRILVQRASGEILIGTRTDIHPGDQIIILPEVPSNLLPILKDITAVIYQIAVGVGVALHL